MSGGRRSLVVAGAGGHAKSVLEVLQERGEVEVIGCTSADGKGSAVLGVPVVGSDRDLLALFEKGVGLAFAAVGDNLRRREVTKVLRRIGFGLVTPVSSKASVAAGVAIGSGAVVMPGGIIRAGAKIAASVIINTAASVDHDCTIEEFVHLAPGVRLAGGVQIGRNAFIGIGSTVAPGVTIGDHAVIGAGSLVLDDIPPRVVAFGSPARAVRDLDGAPHE